MTSPPDRPSQKDARPAGADGELLAAAWTSLEGDLGRERGVLGRLRRAPLGIRVGLALGAAIAVPLALGLAMPRTDLAEVSPLRAGLLVLGLSLLGLVSASLAARPLHRPVLPVWASVLLAVAVSAFLVGVAWVPLALGDAADFTHGALGCGLISGAVAIGLSGAARWLGRGASGAVVGAMGLGVASAFVSVAAICPDDARSHLLVGHALPLTILLALALAASFMPLRPLGAR